MYISSLAYTYYNMEKHYINFFFSFQHFRLKQQSGQYGNPSLCPSPSFHIYQLWLVLFILYPLCLPDHFEVNPRCHIISSVFISVYISERHILYLNITIISLLLKINSNFKILDIWDIEIIIFPLKIHNSFLNIKELSLDF